MTLDDIFFDPDSGDSLNGRAYSEDDYVVINPIGDDFGRVEIRLSLRDMLELMHLLEA